MTDRIRGLRTYVHLLLRLFLWFFCELFCVYKSVLAYFFCNNFNIFLALILRYLFSMTIYVFFGCFQYFLMFLRFFLAILAISPK